MLSYIDKQVILWYIRGHETRAKECSYHYKTLEKRERELDEAWDKAHTITDEDLKIFFGEETS